eukprot:CAMPEP_0183484944 /NCGR_PEP_ID=MMETSP0370-20130417/179176_1 /TAXON_ID=268820 /ORGANISM="Peridinium aciculiferum, Strain PAER-2" /LENGTH=179 /DNA_ID=CAMNT_0025678239 /DNA_START=66 /DNA_END=606 /DNA_ORIENTATION=-
MARSHSAIAPLALLALVALVGLPSAFLPAAPVSVERASLELRQQQEAVAAALVVAAATAPQSALALASSDDDEGFDFRIVAVLGLPVVAASWALFNVWRVAFRQGVRLNEGLSGSSKIGLNAEDDDDEGFDFRIVAVLGLPVVAASWALFNVWRVAFRQGVRLNEGLSGSSKIGLNAED